MKAEEIQITSLRWVEALRSMLRIDDCPLCTLPIKWHQSITVNRKTREVVRCQPFKGEVTGWRLGISDTERKWGNGGG